jgi:ethanolamine ammonia-lyase large subunit
VTITKNKPKLHLPKTQRPVVRLFADDRDDDYYDEIVEFQVGYRRPELVNQTADVDDLSDEIKIRLLLARKRALQAYHQNWS